MLKQAILLAKNNFGALKVLAINTKISSSVKFLLIRCTSHLAFCLNRTVVFPYTNQYEKCV